MIPKSEVPLKLLLQEPLFDTTDWQSQLQNMLTDPVELCQRLKLDNDQQQQMILACQDFPLRVPHSYLSRIKRGDPNDPLLLQVLPRAQELDKPAGYSMDPLQEEQANPVPGLIHKYHGRVLLITNSACPIHCRYCFRRHFPYKDNRNSRQQWQQALDYIKQDNSIHEVILSGGDPLNCSDKQLQWLCSQLGAIPHLRRLRLHTRFPIVIPQRITAECLNWLGHSHLQTCIVLHCNHPNEIDTHVRQALSALKQAGIILLNQSVLLKDINDDANTLATLSESLFEEGVLPYYLHVLDKVQATSHFDIDEKAAMLIYKQLQSQLSGFLVPKLVREEAEQAHKIQINPFTPNL